MIREDFKTNGYRGIIAGLLGGIAYLAKSYNFYFFLLHFTFFVLLYWYGASKGRQRKVLLINGLSGLLVFLLIISCWIGLLTNKYNKLTVSTAGEYNFSFIRPGSPGQMVDTEGLMAPPNNTAFSAWEDPASIKKITWNPFQSISDFKYLLKNTAKNIAIYLSYIGRNHIIFFTIIYFVVMLAKFSIKNTEKTLCLFLTTLLHPIGYLILLAEDRYFWFDYILYYILSAYLLEKISSKGWFTHIQNKLLYAIVISYIAILPFIYINGAGGSIDHFRKIYTISKSLNIFGEFKNSNIASQVEDWSDDLYLSYYLNSRYYGKIRESITDEQLKKEFTDYNIQYFFVHGELKNHIDILRPYKKIDDIIIYKVTSTKDLPKGQNT